MRIGPYTTHPASGSGKFSKLYPHTVYTLCIILIYINIDPGKPAAEVSQT
jgi:hypothetical protein